MESFIAAFIVFFLVTLGMGVGFFFSGKTIKGSCGGIRENPDLGELVCGCKNPCWKAKVKAKLRRPDSRKNYRA